MNTRGFTVLELVIVLAIFAIIVGIVGGFVGSAPSRSDLRYAGTQTVEALRRAQWQTMVGEENSNWSVHFGDHEVVLFKTDVYNAAAVDNVVTLIEDPLRVSNINLQGAGVDVLFDSALGDTNTFGTVVISNDTTQETLTITIHPIGTIDLD